MRQLYLNNFPKKAQARLETGQALLELAIFGSILIMLLGVLVSYGMRYNFQQQVMQETFRKALLGAAESTSGTKPTGVSYIVIKDKHIPSPVNPWGFGSVTPVASSASVVRNYKLQETAEDEESLPVVTINIQGSDKGEAYIKSFRTAGFREEEKVDQDSIDKYKEIYGEVIRGLSKKSTPDKPIWVPIDSDEVKETCKEEITGPSGQVFCTDYVIERIRIIDPCAGEIVDYGNAVRQCRQIVDKQAFIAECEKGKEPGSEKDCNKIANSEINVPWYCQGAQEVNIATHKYYFPVLEEQLFNFARNGEKSMGVQPDYSQTIVANNKLEKIETAAAKKTAAAIDTADTVSWQVTTRRKIVYNDALDSKGVSREAVNITSEDKEDVVSKSYNKAWKTTW